jgi:hypothetical protein
MSCTADSPFKASYNVDPCSGLRAAFTKENRAVAGPPYADADLGGHTRYTSRTAP